MKNGTFIRVLYSFCVPAYSEPSRECFFLFVETRFQALPGIFHTGGVKTVKYNYIPTVFAACGSQKKFHSALPSHPAVSLAATFPGTSKAPPGTLSIHATDECCEKDGGFRIEQKIRPTVGGVSVDIADSRVYPHNDTWWSE